MTPDRLPPHDTAAEAGALACCLIDPNYISGLKLDWFYDLRHRAIAEAILSMSLDCKPVTSATMLSQMTDAGRIEGVGGAQYLLSLEDCTPSAANFPYWAQTLDNLLTLRRIILSATEAVTAAYEPGARDVVADVLEDFERKALAIRQGDIEESTDVKVLVKRGIDELEAAFNAKGQIRGIPSGFPDVDAMTNGFRSGQMIVIAARPSVGKTSLAMNFAERMALDHKIPVGVFSLEMTGAQLILRMQTCRARIDAMTAARGELTQGDFQKLSMVSRAIANAPLVIDGTGGLTVGQLGARARRMKQRHGVRVLIVDYLGLLRCGQRRSNRYEETSIISGAIKTLAKELDVPIIALCQLNRSSEKEERIPRLSDLRDSGSIEQDADFVGLLHRIESEEKSDVQAVKLIIAKQRSGPTGIVDLQFHRNFTRFESSAKV